MTDMGNSASEATVEAMIRAERERRFGLVLIGEEELLRFLRPEVNAGLGDARLLRAGHDFERAAFMFLVASPKLDPVEKHAEPPVIGGILHRPWFAEAVDLICRHVPRDEWPDWIAPTAVRSDATPDTDEEDGLRESVTKRHRQQDSG